MTPRRIPDIITPQFLVQERIDLIEKLLSLEEYFKGIDLIQHGSGFATHPYRHFAALVDYLALTCFDILGQPADWLSFDGWLSSKKKKDERESVIAQYSDLPLNMQLKAVHTWYLKSYGVKNSFYRFIREVISPEDRRKLLDSIRVRITVRPGEKIIQDGKEMYSLPMAIDYPATDLEKEEFLYNARNSFTHKGVSFGSPVPAVFTPERFKGIVEDGWNAVHDEIKGGKQLRYSTYRWPHLLVEILKKYI
jgi:hypothetical protein